MRTKAELEAEISRMYKGLMKPDALEFSGLSLEECGAKFDDMEKALLQYEALVWVLGE